jgi:hypothetical protein
VRTVSRMVIATEPPPPASRRTLVEEVVVVLSLSLLASAAYAVLDLLEAPISGVYVASVNQSQELARQLLAVIFGLAPVYLVLHLVRRSGEGVATLGLATDRPRRDLLSGVVLFAIVGAVGIGIYLAAVGLGVNRFVVPVPPAGHWWRVPMLVLNAASAALLEEVIVLAYLVTRLRQLAWSPWAAIGAAALLRGAYHLYQGWGGFAGNLAMGLLFVAHFLLDVGAGAGFLLFGHRLPGFSG